MAFMSSFLTAYVKTSNLLIIKLILSLKICFIIVIVSIDFFLIFRTWRYFFFLILFLLIVVFISSIVVLRIIERITIRNLDIKFFLTHFYLLTQTF